MINPLKIESDLQYLKEYFVTKGKLQHFRKGELFVHEGDAISRIGFMLSGSFKASFENARDPSGYSVLYFILNRGFVSDMLSFVYEIDSRLTIEAVSDSDVIWMPADMLRDDLQTDAELKEAYGESLKWMDATIANRVMLLYKQDSRLMLLQLLEEYSGLFRLVDAKDIASYLGITPSHLSRLRKQLGV